MSDASSSPAMLTSPTSDPAGDIVSSPIDAMKNLTTFNQEHLAKESMSTEWTDEKHSLYLKSMEASFVNDLYNSFDLLGYLVEHSSDPKSSRRKHNASHSPSGQFKVLQRGCWEKINFEKNRSRSEKFDAPGVLLANPWIRHFRSSSGRQIVATSVPQEKLAFAADISSFVLAEVTDQNFVDEEQIGEKESHTCCPKRIKTSMTPTQGNDQVVPLDNHAMSVDVIDTSHRGTRNQSVNNQFA